MEYLANAAACPNNDSCIHATNGSTYLNDMVMFMVADQAILTDYIDLVDGYTPDLQMGQVSPCISSFL